VSERAIVSFSMAGPVARPYFLRALQIYVPRIIPNPMIPKMNTIVVCPMSKPKMQDPTTAVAIAAKETMTFVWMMVASRPGVVMRQSFVPISELAGSIGLYAL
jgi:hypothetical protein